VAAMRAAALTAVFAVVVLCAVVAIQSAKHSEMQSLSARVEQTFRAHMQMAKAHRMMGEARTVLTQLAEEKSSNPQFGTQVMTGSTGEKMYTKTDSKGKVTSVSVALPANGDSLQDALTVMKGLSEQITSVQQSAETLSKQYRDKKVPKAPTRLQLQAMDIKRITDRLHISPGDSPTTRAALSSIMTDADHVTKSLESIHHDQSMFDREYYEPLANVGDDVHEVPSEYHVGDAVGQ